MSASAVSVEAARRARLRRRALLDKGLRHLLAYIGVLAVTALFVIPFLWLIVTSLKSPDDLAGNPLTWIPNPIHTANYSDALSIIPYMQYLGNTLLICVPNVVSAICFLLTSSSVDQLIALDSFFGVELDERPHQHAFLIGAARVDGQRLADLERALALVDVAVQREERLMFLDCFADCRRADRA